jgi:hypothetical protein
VVSERVRSTIQLSSFRSIWEISSFAIGGSCSDTLGSESPGQRQRATFRAPTGGWRGSVARDLTNPRAEINNGPGQITHRLFVDSGLIEQHAGDVGVVIVALPVNGPGQLSRVQDRNCSAMIRSSRE